MVLRRAKTRGKKLRWLAALALVGLVAASCGDDSDSDTSATTDAPVTTTAAPSATTAAPQTGPGTPAPKPLAEKAKVTVVFSSAQEAWSSLFVGMAMGEFEKENIEVDLQQVKSTDGLVLVNENKADVQFTGFLVGQFNLMEAGGDIKSIANAHSSEPPQQGYYIQKSLLGPDGKPDKEKLKGTTVVAGSGGGAWANATIYPLWRYIKSIGMETSDFAEPLATQSVVDNLQILENNTAAIALLVTPAWQNMPPDGCCVIIPETSGFAASQILMSGKFMEDRPDVAKGFIRALIRTNRTYLQGDYHKDPEVMAALSEALDQPVDRLSSGPSLEFDPDLGYNTDALEGFQTMFREAGALASADNLTAEELADRTLVEEVLAE